MIKESKIVMQQGLSRTTTSGETLLCTKYLRQRFNAEYSEDLPAKIKITISDYRITESSVLFHWAEPSVVEFDRAELSHRFDQGLNRHTTFYAFWEWCNEANLTEYFYITVTAHED
jgi:hypothetical protein